MKTYGLADELGWFYTITHLPEHDPVPQGWIELPPDAQPERFRLLDGRVVPTSENERADRKRLLSGK
jgi:hypothetical protein